MAGYENFQTDNVKTTSNRYDVDKSDFYSPVEVVNSKDPIKRNLGELVKLCSKFRFYPDRFFDAIKPEKGGIELKSYQRIMMRVLVRFPSPSFCVPRGGSKTYIEVLILFFEGIAYPNLHQSLMASTLQSASGLLESKATEIIRHYPQLANEVKSMSFSKDNALIEFSNGSTIDVLAAAQSSKGKRKHRLRVEESNLLSKDILEDAIYPIVNIPRALANGEYNPMELNGSIGRMTTSGYKQSDEYGVMLNTWQSMTDSHKGFLIGFDWRVLVHTNMQRLSTIISARQGSQIRYQQNYLCAWLGSSDGCVTSINKLLASRTIKEPELECPRDKRGNFMQNEYVISVDVARSEKSSNNKSALCVLKPIRSNSGEIRQIHCVNIETLPTGLTFDEQSQYVKRVFYRYGGNLNINLSMVSAIVVDSNGVGGALVDSLLAEQTDDETNEELGCFATMNTEQQAKDPEAPEIVFSFKAQGINSKAITLFQDVVESGKLKLVREFKDIQTNGIDDLDTEIACDQMQYFIDEVANLKIKLIKGGKEMTVEQISKKFVKDRYSAVLMGNYYIQLNMQEDNNSSGDYDYCIDYSTN